MTDLISRLSALTGSDREVDGEIALAHGWTRGQFRTTDHYWVSPPVAGKSEVRPSPPRYTASIDAALTLMHSGWSWDIGSWAPDHNDNDTYYAEIHAPQLAEGYACTPAIALLIAIMKAREVAEQSKDQGDSP